uniref:LITAF domain-containing protein n=1 Tax=Panagrellus redivivus TaxID=6233 RepID=A0A7E4ZUX8_PANRE
MNVVMKTPALFIIFGSAQGRTAMWWRQRVVFELLLLFLSGFGLIGVEATGGGNGSVIRHKLAVLLNFPKTGQFEAISEKVTKTIFEVLDDPSDSNIELVAHIVHLNSSTDETREVNRLQITQETVCQELLNDSIAVVLLQHSSVTRGSVRAAYSAAAYALGFYRVPAIGVMMQDAEFSRKNLYPTFLRTSPPFSNEAPIMLKLLKKLSYRQVVVVTVEGDVNGNEFTTAFEEHRIAHDVHVQKYVELYINESLPTMLVQQFEEVTSNAVILCAKKTDAEAIFNAAKNYTGSGKVWIVNQGASDATNLPTGFLSIRLKQSAISALRDALTVIKRGVSVLEEYHGKVLPPSQCANIGHSNEWTNAVGTKFYKHLIQSPFYADSHQIQFNSKGDRINVAYEIVNKREDGFLVVGFAGDSYVDLTLEESAILWPGAESVKPLEITLPKHLRVVTVADPPFVYTIAVEDPSACATFKTVLIDDVNVPGPWFPCAMPPNDQFCCSGYAIDLLSNLSLSGPESTIDTGFTFDIHLNQSYGAVLLGDDGYYLSGLIGELDADTADLGIGALTINPEREHYIDFSEPWLYHGIRVLEKWVRPSLWYALLGTVFLVGFVIYCLDFNSPFDRFYQTRELEISEDDPFWEPTEDDRVTFGEAMWFVWGVLLNSGVSEKTPRSFSARVLGLVWCGFCMIMVASYTANLAAFLVLEQPEKSLSGINDPRLRNPSANFSYATVLETNTYQHFKRHVELSTMFRKMEGHNVHNPQDAINALLNDTLGAFIWDSTRLNYEAMKNCKLRARGALFGRSAYGIGLQKHSPWTPHITNAILRLSESGITELLDVKWISGAARKPCVFETHKSPARLGLINMKDVFILVSGGILLGSVFSFLEVKLGQARGREIKRRQLAKRYASIWRRLIQTRKTATLLSPRLPEKRSYVDPHAKMLPFQNAIDTQPRAVIGHFVYASVAFFIVTLLWPCAPLPCFLTMFADYEHVCPICGHIVGRFRRGGKPVFYV